jgi:predicted CXXCH cytochrome family protein
MGPTSTARRSLGLALVVLLCLLRFGRAGEYHSPDNSNCSDCHTTHNSAQGAPMRYDGQAQPANVLLRAADPDQLCLQCHDGSNPQVPDVVAPIDYTSDPSGGGFPSSWWEATIPLRAHVIGGDPLTPPGGSLPMTLSCISCHDPHGNGSFRSLRLDPARTGVSLPVAAVDTVTSSGGNAAQVYATGNTKYRSGLAAWCGACHGTFHVGATGLGPWLVHPQDRTLSTSPHADFDAWSGTFPNRIRVQTPIDDEVPSADDQVFCLSCHRAHGSPNRHALVYADGATQDSTCAQCHDK